MTPEETLKASIASLCAHPNSSEEYADGMGDAIADYVVGGPAGGSIYAEYANRGAFPGTGTLNKIYVALDTGASYRWDGDSYEPLASAGPIAHDSTSGINSGNIQHLTSAQKADLTDGGDSSAHYHASDRTFATAAVATHVAAPNPHAQYLLATEKGAANGLCELDGIGYVPLARIPIGLLGAMRYQATWDASTNTPTLPALPDATTKGMFWKVCVKGTYGDHEYNPFDLIISNGTSWDWIDNSEVISTVFGRVGAITAQAGDYNAGQVTFTPAGGVAATNVQAAIAELDTEKQASIPAGTTLQYYRGDKVWATLDKAAVGLGNVDNTSDANKPISTATQSALDAKSPLNTTLTDNAGSSTLPVTASGTLVSKIQALRDNVKYILANWLQLGETSATAYRGDRGKTAYDHSQLTASNPHGTTAAQIAFTPVGGVATTNVQAAIAELDMEKAYNVHSHVISDVTGLQSALDSVVQFNRGYATSSGYWWNCMVFSVSRASGSYDEQGGVFSFVSFGGMSADTAKTCKIIIELKNQSGTVTHSVKMVDSSNDMPIRVLYYSSSDGNNYLHIIPYVSVYSSVTVYAHQNDGYFAKNPSGMVGSSYTYELMGVPSTTVITDSSTLPAGAPIGKMVISESTSLFSTIYPPSGESIVWRSSTWSDGAGYTSYSGTWFTKVSGSRWRASDQ